MIYDVNLWHLPYEFKEFDENYNELYVVKFKDALGEMKQFIAFPTKFKIKEEYQGQFKAMEPVS